jgi:hypothetical protein
MVAVTSEEAPLRRRGRGRLVTMATFLSLVAGLGLTVLRLGFAGQAVASFDSASCLRSRGQGDVARINGVTAKVRVEVPPSSLAEAEVLDDAVRSAPMPLPDTHRVAAGP